MIKKETNLNHSQIANNIMNYINTYIDTDINIKQLSIDFKISKFHLHRIFKEQIGTNIYETIKSIRLQKASNLLISNRYSTITQTASLCGYSSQTSFIRAFKQRFEQTPKQWRKGGYKDYSNKILGASKTASLAKVDFSHLEPKIVQTKSKKAYYIRQKGYDRQAIQTWQKMTAWAYTNNITNYEERGIYHDNPIITPLQDCYYIAAIIPLEDKNFEHLTLPSFMTDEGIYASFEAKGKYGDILNLIQWVYHHWLPNSGFETTTIASHTVFKKNHFLDKDGEFEIVYYVPVRYL